MVGIVAGIGGRVVHARARCQQVPQPRPSFDRQQAAGVVDAQFAERAVQVNHAAVDIPSIQHRQNALAHRIHDARPVERAVTEQLLAIDHHHHRGRGQGLQALARGGDGLPANRAQSGLRMHAPCALFRCARQIDVIPRPGAGSGHGRQHQGPDDAGPSIARLHRAAPSRDSSPAGWSWHASGCGLLGNLLVCISILRSLEHERPFNAADPPAVGPRQPMQQQ